VASRPCQPFTAIAQNGSFVVDARGGVDVCGVLGYFAKHLPEVKIAGFSRMGNVAPADASRMASSHSESHWYFHSWALVAPLIRCCNSAL